MTGISDSKMNHNNKTPLRPHYQSEQMKTIRNLPINLEREMFIGCPSPGQKPPLPPKPKIIPPKPQITFSKVESVKVVNNRTNQLTVNTRTNHLSLNNRLHNGSYSKNIFIKSNVSVNNNLSPISLSLSKSLPKSPPKSSQKKPPPPPPVRNGSCLRGPRSRTPNTLNFSQNSPPSSDTSPTNSSPNTTPTSQGRIIPIIVETSPCTTPTNEGTLPIEEELICATGTRELLFSSPPRQLDEHEILMENALEHLEDEIKRCSDISSGSISDSESDGEQKDCSYNNSQLVNTFLMSVSPSSQFGSTPSIEGCDTDSNGSQSEDDKRLRKAFLIAKEIMTTEDSFVNILKLLNVKFREFLTNKGCISTAKSASHGTKAIPESELNQILKHLPNLQNLNEGLLTDFKSRLADWDTRPIIADIIHEKGPFLKIYATYIKEIESQTNLLEECAEKYTFFGSCLREFESSGECLHLPVGRHLLAPMQRITRYKELMKAYLKQLKEGDADYENAMQAYDIVKEVAEHSNEAIRQLDNFSRLLALQDRLNGTTDSNPPCGPPVILLVEPGRSLVRVGQVLKLCRRGVRMVYLILLSDSLLYTTQVAPLDPRSPLKLNYKMPLEGMRVEVPLADEFNTEVSVISTSRSFTIRVRSPSERDAWLHALQDAITINASKRNSFQLVSEGDESVNNLEGLGKQAPVWIPDDRVTMCQLCTTEFTLTFRRHHCRACGKVICKLCSHNRHPLAYLNTKRVRVCDLCFEVLQDEVDGAQNSSDSNNKAESQRLKVKKGIRDSHRWRSRKKPERLMEVCGSDHESQMCGYLKHSSRKGIWRHAWFVLKERVLYEYAAPQDVCALSSLPVLGYTIHFNEEETENEGEVSTSLGFELHHPNQTPIVFEAETSDLSSKWISAMGDAVKL